MRHLVLSLLLLTSSANAAMTLPKSTIREKLLGKEQNPLPQLVSYTPEIKGPQKINSDYLPAMDCQPEVALIRNEIHRGMDQRIAMLAECYVVHGKIPYISKSSQLAYIDACEFIYYSTCIFKHIVEMTYLATFGNFNGNPFFPIDVSGQYQQAKKEIFALAKKVPAREVSIMTIADSEVDISMVSLSSIIVPLAGTNLSNQNNIARVVDACKKIKNQILTEQRFLYSILEKAKLEMNLNNNSLI